MKSTALLLIVSTLWSPLWAVSLQSEISTTPVGVLRLGALEEEENGLALSRLERSIAKWLDRLPIDTNAQAIRIVQNNNELRDELQSLRFHQLIERFYSLLETKPFQAGNELDELHTEDFVAFLARPDSGPFRQQAYLARAAHEWRLGNPDRAQPLLRAAVYENPFGLVSEVPSWGWDSEANGDSVNFEVVLSGIIKSVRRPCQINVGTSPEKALVRLNGFPMRASQPVRILARSDLQIQAQAEGYEAAAHSLSCDKLGVRSVQLKLRRRSEPVPTLATVAKSNAVKSLLLVSPVGEEARLFLFTPGLRVDEVQTSRPILLADFRGEEASAHPSIKTDAFTSLVEAHRVAWLDRRDPLQPPIEYRNSLETDISQQWYNDWKVWAVVGGIVGGVVITYLATRQPEVMTNPPRGLRIQID